jgi:hypothetical protein
MEIEMDYFEYKRINGILMERPSISNSEYDWKPVPKPDYWNGIDGQWFKNCETKVVDDMMYDWEIGPD